MKQSKELFGLGKDNSEISNKTRRKKFAATVAAVGLGLGIGACSNDSEPVNARSVSTEASPSTSETPEVPPMPEFDAMKGMENYPESAIKIYNTLIDTTFMNQASDEEIREACTIHTADTFTGDNFENLYVDEQGTIAAKNWMFHYLAALNGIWQNINKAIIDDPYTADPAQLAQQHVDRFLSPCVETMLSAQPDEISKDSALADFTELFSNLIEYKKGLLKYPPQVNIYGDPDSVNYADPMNIEGVAVSIDGVYSVKLSPELYENSGTGSQLDDYETFTISSGRALKSWDNDGGVSVHLKPHSGAPALDLYDSPYVDWD